MNDDSLNLALRNFQDLEYSLKNAIAKYEAVIRERTSGYVNFPDNSKRIGKMSMGTLATKYSEYSGNHAVKAKIEHLAQYRNELAHRMFMRNDEIGNFLEPDLQCEIDEIFAQSKEAISLSESICEAMEQLYYDSNSQCWKKA